MTTMETKYGGTAAEERLRTGAGTMKAVVFNKYGGVEAAEVKDTPRPKAGPGQVLIQVRAAGINPVDWKVLAGMRKPGADTFPKVLGLECSGVVEEADSQAPYLKKGAQVIGYSDIDRLGAYAEYIVLPQDRVYPKPEKIPFEAAACLPIAACTAFQALRNLGKIEAGTKVLINGASGGVGHFAVQIARIFKADVTAVCGAAGAELVRSLGADRVIDRAKADFTREKARYNIVFDAVAKSSFDACEAVMADNGVYISTLPVEPVAGGTSKRAIGMRNVPTPADIAWLTTEMEAGTLKAVIDKTFPLEQAREALSYSERGNAHGKVVLKIS